MKLLKILFLIVLVYLSIGGAISMVGSLSAIIAILSGKAQVVESRPGYTLTSHVLRFTVLCPIETFIILGIKRVFRSLKNEQTESLNN